MNRTPTLTKALAVVATLLAPSTISAQTPSSLPHWRATLGVCVVAVAAGAATPDGDGDCVGDLNGDGSVDNADLILLLGNWGPCDVPGCGIYLQYFEDAITDATRTAFELVNGVTMPLAIVSEWGDPNTDEYEPDTWEANFPSQVQEGMTAFMLDIEGKSWEWIDEEATMESRRVWVDMIIEMAEDTRRMLDENGFEDVDLVAYNIPKSTGWDKTDPVTLDMVREILQHFDAGAPVLFPNGENEAQFERREQWVDEHFAVLDAIGMTDDVKTFFLVSRGWKVDPHGDLPLAIELLSDAGYARLLEIGLDERGDGVTIFGQYGHPNRDFSESLPDGCDAECAMIRDTMILFDVLADLDQ